MPYLQNETPNHQNSGLQHYILIEFPNLGTDIDVLGALNIGTSKGVTTKNRLIIYYSIALNSKLTANPYALRAI